MKDINYNAFNEYIIEEEQTALLFFSRKTCHVCQKIHPLVDELEKEFSNVTMYHVDAEENENIMNKCKVKGVPQLIFFKNGEEVFRLTGEHDYDDLADAVEEYLND